MKKTFTTLVITTLFYFLATACSSSTPLPVAATSTPDMQLSSNDQTSGNQQTYPAPPTYAYTGNLANSAYPAPTKPEANVSAYPGPMPTARQGTAVQPVPFLIKTPVKQGATKVSGTGPANIPIALADITFNGEILSTAVVGEDGNFTFEVKPLESGHRIGVGLANLEGTPWVSGNFNDPGFKGNQAMSIPNIGFFFDTVIVEK